MCKNSVLFFILCFLTTPSFNVFCDSELYSGIEIIDFSDFMDDDDDVSLENDTRGISDEDLFDIKEATHKDSSLVSEVVCAVTMHSVATYYTCKKALLACQKWLCEYAYKGYSLLG